MRSPSSSSPVAVDAAHEEQGSKFPRLRQLLRRVFPRVLLNLHLEQNGVGLDSQPRRLPLRGNESDQAAEEKGSDRESSGALSVKGRSEKSRSSGAHDPVQKAAHGWQSVCALLEFFGVPLKHIPVVFHRLKAALYFDVLLCASGRHWHRDRSARAKCCNGWRPGFSYVSINGEMREVTSWRPINANDPRFPWESVRPASDEGFPPGAWLERSSFRGPDVSGYDERCELDGPELEVSPRRRALMVQARKLERDWSTDQRLERLRANCLAAGRAAHGRALETLSLIDAHHAAGGVL